MDDLRRKLFLALAALEQSLIKCLAPKEEYIWSSYEEMVKFSSEEFN
jgi:hypothetical protein